MGLISTGGGGGGLTVQMFIKNLRLCFFVSDELTSSPRVTASLSTRFEPNSVSLC